MSSKCTALSNFHSVSSKLEDFLRRGLLSPSGKNIDVAANSHRSGYPRASATFTDPSDPDDAPYNAIDGVWSDMMTPNNK
jgi:hypothetical protein